MARKRGGSWVANFGRSVAFGLGNAAMDNMTTVKSLKDNNEEFMKNVYETMKDIKNLQSTIIDKYYDSSEDAKEVKDALKDLKENGSKGFKNFLKNGTIGLSDEEREKNEMKAFGMEDMDFDLGDLDSGEDDLEKALAGVDEDEDLMTPMEKKTSDIGNAQLKAVNDNTRAEVAIGQRTANAIENVAKVTTNQTEILAGGIAAGNKLQANIAESNAALQTALSNRVVTGLGTLNETANKLVAFNTDMMGRQIDASMKFYTDSLTELQKISSILERAFPEDKGREQRESAYSESGLDMGRLNINGYLKQVRRNFDDTTAGMMISQFADPQMIKMFAADPLGVGAEMAFSFLMPQVLEKSMKKFDESISEFIPALIGKITDYGENGEGPLTWLAKLFGVPLPSSKINVRNYEKGAVPFDGITHRTINQVIPRYLSEIVGLLGGERMMYDYNEARFKTNEEIKKDVDREKESDVHMAMDFDTMEKYRSEFKKLRHYGEGEKGRKQDEQNDKDLERIFKAIAMSGQNTIDVKNIGKYLEGKDIGAEAKAIFQAITNRMDYMDKYHLMNAPKKFAQYQYDRYGRRGKTDYKYDYMADNFDRRRSEDSFHMSDDESYELQKLTKEEQRSKRYKTEMTTQQKKRLKELRKKEEEIANGTYRIDEKPQEVQKQVSTIDKILETNNQSLNEIKSIHELLSNMVTSGLKVIPMGSIPGYGSGRRQRRRRNRGNANIPPIPPAPEQNPSTNEANNSEVLTTEENPYNAPKGFDREGRITIKQDDSSDIEELLENALEEGLNKSGVNQDWVSDFQDKLDEIASNEKDKEEEKKEAEQEKKEEEGREENFLDRFMQMLHSPIQTVAVFMDKVSAGLYNLFFDTEGNKDSIVKTLKSSFDDLVKGIKDTLHEEFFNPLKNFVYKDIMEGGLRNSVNNTITRVRNFFTDAFEEDYGEEKPTVRNVKGENAENAPTAAFGRILSFAFGGKITDAELTEKRKMAAKSAKNGGPWVRINQTKKVKINGRDVILHKGEYYNPKTSEVIPTSNDEGNLRSDQKEEYRYADGDGLNEYIKKYMKENGFDKNDGFNPNNQNQKVANNIEKIAENTKQTTEAVDKQTNKIDQQKKEEKKEAQEKKTPNSIKENVKSLFGEIKDDLSMYIFGKNTDKYGKQKPLVNQIQDMFAVGTKKFNNFFFGQTEYDSKESMDQYKESFKKSLPKGIARGLVFGGGLTAISAAGGFGLLGSLFLPGGPIGSAILGMGIGLLSENRKLKDWLFGPADENGNRKQGGVVPKSFINFFQRNKKTIIGAGAFGTLQGITGISVIGSLLSLLPGGMGGAIGFLPGLGVSIIGPTVFSIAAAMAFKSNRVQNILFGKPDEKTGKRIGGVLQSESAKTLRKQLPSIVTGAAIGAGSSLVLGNMGILGSLALGPWTSAIIGGAIGFGLTSKKFKEALFGKQDKNGNFISGGIVDRMKKFFKVEFYNKFANFLAKQRVEFKKFFQLRLLDLKKIFTPAKLLGKQILEGAKKSIKNVFDMITGQVKSIFSPILKPFQKAFSWLFHSVMDAGSSIANTAMSAARGLITAPLKLITAPFNMLGRHYRKNGTDEQKAAMAEADKKDAEARKRIQMQYESEKRIMENKNRARDIETDNARKHGYKLSPEELEEKTRKWQAEQEALANSKKQVEMHEQSNEILDAILHRAESIEEELKRNASIDRQVSRQGKVRSTIKTNKRRRNLIQAVQNNKTFNAQTANAGMEFAGKALSGEDRDEASYNAISKMLLRLGRSKKGKKRDKLISRISGLSKKSVYNVLNKMQAKGTDVSSISKIFGHVTSEGKPTSEDEPHAFGFLSDIAGAAKSLFGAKDAVSSALQSAHTKDAIGQGIIEGNKTNNKMKDTATSNRRERKLSTGEIAPASSDQGNNKNAQKREMRNGFADFVEKAFGVTKGVAQSIGTALGAAGGKAKSWVKERKIDKGLTAQGIKEARKEESFRQQLLAALREGRQIMLGGDKKKESLLSDILDMLKGAGVLGAILAALNALSRILSGKFGGNYHDTRVVRDLAQGALQTGLGQKAKKEAREKLEKVAKVFKEKMKAGRDLINEKGIGKAFMENTMIGRGLDRFVVQPVKKVKNGVQEGYRAVKKGVTNKIDEIALQMKYGPRDLLYDNDKGEMVHKRWNKNYVDPETGKKFGKYIESTDGSLHDIQWMREQEKAAGRAPDQARKDMYKNIREKAAKLTNPFGIRTKLSEFGGRMYKAGSEPFKKAWNGYTTKSGKQVAGVKKIGRFARDAAKKGAKKAAKFSLEATKIAGKLALAGAFSPITAGYFAAKGGKKLVNLAENKLPAMIEKGKNEIGKFASWVASSDTVKNAKKGIRSVKKGIGTAKKAISDEVGLIYKEGKENVARRYGAAKKAVGNQIEKVKNLPKKAWNSKVVKKARFNVETTKEILQKRASDKISDISKAVGGYADSVVGWFSRKKKNIVKELDKVTIHGTELTKIPGALAKQAETEAATIFGMVRSGGAQLAQSGPIQAMMSGVRTAASVAVAPFKAVGGMGMELYRSGAHALESIGKAGAEAAEEVGEKAAEAKATFTSFKDMRSKIVKEAKGGLKKFKSLATKAISFITSNETVQKFLGGDGGGKLAEKFKGVLEKVGPKEFASIAKKAAKAAAKVAGTAVTLGLSQLAFSAYDAYSGVTDAAEMWGVLPEDCTAGMKTAAAILNVIMGLGPMVYVDLAFEAVYLGTSMLGQSDPINIKREILLVIYECLPDSYDEEEVKGLQDKANSDYENYLMEQYKQMTGATDEQIAGMSAEQKKQAMEQAQQNGAKSKDDYLAEKNDAHTPVMDEIRGTTLGSWLFGSNDENGNYQPGFFSNAKDFLLGNRKKGQKSVFGRVSDALFGTGEEDENGDVDKGIIGTAKDKITGFVTGIGNFFGDIGDFLFKKSMDEKLEMIWKYFVGGTDENGEYQLGVFPKVWGKIQDFGNGVMKFFDDLGSKFTGALNVLKSDNQNGFNLLTAPFTILANVARGMLGLDMSQNPIKDSISQFLHMDAFGPFTSLFNWLGTTFDNTIGWAAGELEKKGLIEGTWSIIKGMWSGIWGWIDSGSTGSAIELISSSLSDMTSGISDTFHNVMKWFKELYDGVSKADTLGAKFDVVKNMLKGLFGVKPDEDFLSTAFGKMQKAIGGAFDTIKKKWNDIKDWWDKFDPKQIFWDAMKKAFPKFSEALDDTKARWEQEHPEDKGTGIYSGSGYSRTATIRGAGNIMKSYGFNPNGSGSGNSEYGTYTQNDSAWGSKRTIANGSMSQVGCGPTTLANGMNSAFGLNMTPMQAANLIQPGDLPVDGSPGVTANYFPEAVNALGGEYIGLDPNNPRSVEAALQSGFTMVAGGKSMDNGTSQAFTAGGHYTMLKGGYTKGGIPYTYSYDPLGGNREKPIALDRVLRDVNREGGPNMIGMIAPKGTDASAFGGVSFNNPMYQYNGFGSGTGDSVDKIGLFTQNFATIMKDYAMGGLLGKPYTGSVLNDGSNHSSSNSSSSTINPGNVSGDYRGIVNGLMQLGFTKVAAAGIAGNIMQESSMDPNADNGSHHGLVQWDHANRWASAVAWCQSHGLDPNSIAGQLAYVAEECKQSGLFDQMNACSSPEEAARLFEAEFERSNGSAVGNRINYANEAFAQAGGSGLRGGTGLSRVKNIVSRYIGRRSSGTGTDNWTEQTGGVSSDGAQPQTMAMLDDLGAWFKGKTGHKLVVTAITNGSHASGEFSHANGWKADVNDWSGPEGLTGGWILGDGGAEVPGSLAAQFEEYGNSKGVGVNWENDHFDLSAAGDQWADPLHSGGKKGKLGGYNGDGKATPSSGKSNSGSTKGGSDPWSTFIANIGTIGKDYAMAMLAGKVYQGSNLQTPGSNSTTSGSNGNFSPSKDVTGLPLGSVAMAAAKEIGYNHPELMWAQMVGAEIGPSNVASGVLDTDKYSDHNYAGLTWQEGMPESKRGFARPADEGGYYCKYNSDEEYAKDWVHNFAGTNALAGRNDIDTPMKYAQHMKDYGYYTSDNVSGYAANMQAALDYPDFAPLIKNISGSGAGLSATPYGPLTASQAMIKKFDDKEQDRYEELRKKYPNMDFNLRGWRDRDHLGDKGNAIYQSPWQGGIDQIRHAQWSNDGPITMAKTSRIEELTNRYGLKYDDYGNLIGYDGPDYNKIDGTEDQNVKYSKQAQQIALYLEKHPEIANQPSANAIEAPKSTEVPNNVANASMQKNIQKANNLLDESTTFGDWTARMVKKYGLTFDGSNNLKELEGNIPDEINNTGVTDLATVYENERKQMMLWIQKNPNGKPRTVKDIELAISRGIIKPDDIKRYISQYGIKFDQRLNVQMPDYTIPEEIKITGSEKTEGEIYHKQGLQILDYAQKHGTKLKMRRYGIEDSVWAKQHGYFDANGKPTQQLYGKTAGVDEEGYLVDRNGIRTHAYSQRNGGHYSIDSRGRVHRRGFWSKLFPNLSDAWYRMKDNQAYNKEWNRRRSAGEIPGAVLSYSGSGLTTPQQTAVNTATSMNQKDIFSGIDTSGDWTARMVKKYGLTFDENNNLVELGKNIPQNIDNTGIEDLNVVYENERKQVMEWIRKNPNGKPKSANDISTAFSRGLITKDDISKYVNQYGLKFDEMLNVAMSDYEIPEEMKITGNEKDEKEIYHKQGLQIADYAQKHGTKLKMRRYGIEDSAWYKRTHGDVSDYGKTTRVDVNGNLVDATGLQTHAYTQRHKGHYTVDSRGRVHRRGLLSKLFPNLSDKWYQMKDNQEYNKQYNAKLKEIKQNGIEATVEKDKANKIESDTNTIKAIVSRYKLTPDDFDSYGNLTKMEIPPELKIDGTETSDEIKYHKQGEQIRLYAKMHDAEQKTNESVTKSADAKIEEVSQNMEKAVSQETAAKTSPEVKNAPLSPETMNGNNTVTATGTTAASNVLGNASRVDRYIAENSAATMDALINEVQKLDIHSEMNTLIGCMNTLIKNQVEGAKIISKASSSNGNAGSGMADEALRAMSKNVQNNRSIAPPPAQGHGGNNTNISKGNDPSATHQKAMQMAMGGQMAAG